MFDGLRQACLVCIITRASIEWVGDWLLLHTLHEVEKQGTVHACTAPRESGSETDFIYVSAELA